MCIMRELTLLSAAFVCIAAIFLFQVTDGRPNSRDPGFVRMLEHEEHYIRPAQRKRESPIIRRAVERPTRMGRSGLPEERHRRRLVRSGDHFVPDISDQGLYQAPRPRMKSQLGHDHKLKKYRYRIHSPDYGKYNDDYWLEDVSFRKPERQSRRLKAPHRKREDRGMEGESVIIRYVPRMRNGESNSLYQSSSEDPDMVQSFYDNGLSSSDQLVPLSYNEGCPYCKHRPLHHHHHHHRNLHEDDLADSFSSYYPTATSTSSHPDEPTAQDDLSRHSEAETQYYHTPTVDYTITEQTFPLVTSDLRTGQNHLRHFAEFNETPEESHNTEELVDEVSTPTMDLQPAPKRGKRLEFILSADGNGNLARSTGAVMQMLGHDIGRDFSTSEKPTNGMVDPRIEAPAEESNKGPSDILSLLTNSPKTPMATEG